MTPRPSAHLLGEITRRPSNAEPESLSRFGQVFSPFAFDDAVVATDFALRCRLYVRFAVSSLSAADFPVMHGLLCVSEVGMILER